MTIRRIQTVYVPAADVGRTAGFYEAILGTAPRFRDGDRWVQFAVAETQLAIASTEEAATGAAGVVIVFPTDDPGDHDMVVSRGAEFLDERDMGDHGRTRTYRDPAGTIFQLYWRA